jgi:16S rRNA (cytosine967-C5)-methyltransferase
VFKAEGQDRIDAFLQRHADASTAPNPPSPGHLLPLPDNGAERSTQSDGTSMDGFFLALIAKS